MTENQELYEKISILYSSVEGIPKSKARETIKLCEEVMRKTPRRGVLNRKIHNLADSIIQ